MTQENPEPVESLSEKSFSATEGEKNPFSSSRVRTYSSISSSSFENESNFTILYGRPDLKEYISRGIQEECDKNYRKAFACLGVWSLLPSMEKSTESVKRTSGLVLLLKFTATIESFG